MYRDHKQSIIRKQFQILFYCLYKLITLLWLSLYSSYDEKGQAYHEHTKVCEVVTGAGDVTLVTFPQG